MKLLAILLLSLTVGVAIGLLIADFTNNQTTFFGDSLAVNLGAAGVSGEKTWQGLPRFERLVESKEIEKIYYAEGINDILHGAPEWMTYCNVRQAAWLAEKNGVEFVLLGMPPINFQNPELNEKATRINTFYSELAKEEGFEFIDTRGCVSESDLIDDVHLSPEGIEKLRRCIDN